MAEPDVGALSPPTPPIRVKPDLMGVGAVGSPAMTAPEAPAGMGAGD